MAREDNLPSRRSYERAFKQFAEDVGSDWASMEGELTRTYTDPYNPGPADEFIPQGVVFPASVEEVQAVVKTANKYEIPIWPVSAGKNLTYGGPSPRMKGTVTVDLKRINRVLEVDDELAYCVVEPGVSFFDLHEYLQKNGHQDLMPSVPGPGWGSIIGNGLERGAGQHPYGEMIASSYGFEVVLPNGELMRTGMAAMTGAKTAHLHPFGFGPDVHGLFAQSNMGIVTKMGRWLYQRPEVVMCVDMHFDNEDDYIKIVDAVRPLRMEGTILTMAGLYNLTLQASLFTTRKQWYEGDGPVPPEILQKMKTELGLSEWQLNFALYGTEEQVEAHWKRVQERFKDIPHRADPRPYRKGDVVMHPGDQHQNGIPNMALFGWLNWKESGVHADFSPISPATGSDAKEVYETVKGIAYKWGFDCILSLGVENRFMRQIFLVLFNRYDEEEKRKARLMFEEMIQEYAKRGWGENRTHLAFMDSVAQAYDFNDNALLRFQQQIKDSLDPNGILAPGKSGIWPERFREDA